MGMAQQVEMTSTRYSAVSTVLANQESGQTADMEARSMKPANDYARATESPDKVYATIDLNSVAPVLTVHSFLDRCSPCLQGGPPNICSRHPS